MSSAEETNLILQFLERNLVVIIIGIITLVCLVIILIRGADKVFPKFKKAKLPGGIEIERDCGDAKEGEKKEVCERRVAGRRSTDVCQTHCDIADALVKNKQALEELKNTNKKLVEHEEEVWLMILEDRFRTLSQEMSVRMISGLTCLWWGKNGDFKEEVLAFIKENPDVYKHTIKCRPELRLGNYAEGRKPANI